MDGHIFVSFFVNILFASLIFCFNTIIGKVFH